MPTSQGSHPDYSARDEAIRVNTYTTVLRRDGVPHADFAAYWRDVHGPLCSRLPGLGWYVQYHFHREQDGHLWPVVADVEPLPGYVLDGAVEIGFASAGEQETFQDASPLLFSDEQNMFGETLAYDLPAGSQTLLDQRSDPVPNGPERQDRMHVHFSARPGARSDLGAAVRDALAPALLAEEDLTGLRVHDLSTREADADLPPAPNVAHHAGPGRRELLVAEVAFTDPLARRRALQSEPVQQALRAVAGTVEHVTAFPVSGVYTFVRDGRLSAAGLRGSRAAELITRLAATNQLTPEVEGLFTRGG